MKCKTPAERIALILDEHNTARSLALAGIPTTTPTETSSDNKRMSLEGCSVTLSELLRLAGESLERLQIPSAIVGSFASDAWGKPRTTRDIDIVLRLDSPCSSFHAGIIGTGRIFFS